MMRKYSRIGLAGVALAGAFLSTALAGPVLAAERPTVTNVIPRHARSAGGTSVTIIGTNFTGATAVKFGTPNAASFTVNSSTAITAVSPPREGQTFVVDVTVTTPAGTSSISRADKFAYFPECAEGKEPVVTSIEPQSGGAGTSVRIKGERFFTFGCFDEAFSAERVLFGFNEAAFEHGGNEHELLAVAPPGTGTVDVTVESGLGQSAVNRPADQFTYVALNEPHWYENHVPLSAQSGRPGQEGEQALLWGKLLLADAGSGIGTAECQTEWGGNVYNPGGAVGSAAAGEAKIDGFQAYNCTSTVCETTDNSRLSVEPEGLGVVVEGGVARRLEWEAKLSAGPTRLRLGDKTAGSSTQIKWHLVCPKTGGAEYNKKWKGELAPELENGTAVGSSPSKLTFNSGELEVEATTEGKVSNKLRMMGFEGGEIISTKNP